MAPGVRAGSVHESFMRHFEDPITLEVMNKPVVDECGCIFDEASIQSYYNRHHKIGEEGEYAICPMTGKFIHMDQLRPMRIFKAVIEDVQKITERNGYLKLQEENEGLLKRGARVAHNDMKRDRRLGALEKTVAVLIQNQALAVQQAKIRERQTDNLMKMGIVETFVGIFIPKVRVMVRDRGLTETDHRILATEPSVPDLDVNDGCEISSSDPLELKVGQNVEDEYKSGVKE